MKNSAKLYFPLFNNSGESMDNLRTFTIKDITMYFGGMTAYRADGYYTMSDGTVKFDNIEVMEVYFDKDVFTKGSYPIDYLKALAGVVCKDAKQECVLLVVDNESMFIESED